MRCKLAASRQGQRAHQEGRERQYHTELNLLAEPEERYDDLKAEKHALYGEYKMEELLKRSRAAQASAEKRLNHALDAKALAVEERIGGAVGI